VNKKRLTLKYIHLKDCVTAYEHIQKAANYFDLKIGVNPLKLEIYLYYE
jgi:hypothetical protein